MQLKKEMKMGFKYSIRRSRPAEIYRYSLFGNSLRFDYTGFKPYRLNEALRPGPNYSVGEPISLKTGVKNYHRKIFGKEESRVRNLLLTIVAYESASGIRPDAAVPGGEVEIYCHNGLHSDLVLGTSDVYHVILHKNKLIFANTDDRSGNDPLFAYIGIKFETILCNEPSPVDGSHNKLLLQGRYGRWGFKSVVEIDSYRASAAKTLAQMGPAERYRNYCEIKLCFSPSRRLGELLLKTKSKRRFLLVLKGAVRNFAPRAEKWLFQSYFGRQDKLVIGVRNSKFELICNEEIDVVHDFLPFVKDVYPDIHDRFLHSIDVLDEAYAHILHQVRALQQSDTDVFELRCDTRAVRVLADAPDHHIFRKILVPEYLAWVDRGEDTLAHSDWVAPEAYAAHKDPPGHDLHEQLASKLHIV